MPQVGQLFSTMKQAKLQYKYAYRRLKGVKHKLQNDKFINSIIKGGTNIFQEIKKFRGKPSNCSSRIDDNSMRRDIMMKKGKFVGKIN